MRATVFGSWAPARPIDSFAYDVRSVRLRQLSAESRSRDAVVDRVIREPEEVDGLAATFNALTGSIGTGFMSCPQGPYPRYVLKFRTPTGDLTAESSADCLPTWTIRRDGRVVQPPLAGFDLLKLAQQYGEPVDLPGR